jgi:hypothetical protein
LNEKSLACEAFSFGVIGTGLGLGRQFVFRFLGLRLSLHRKMTVQKRKCVSHTAVSKEDFSELTVERAKALGSTAAFIIFQ